MTGYQPIRDQYFLIRSVLDIVTPLPFQCDALQQTVNSLESTLVLRVKELNETYEDLDLMKSDLRVAEVSSWDSGLDTRREWIRDKYKMALKFGETVLTH